MKEAVITSSVLILCIVLLRWVCRRKISAKLQYMLWLVVAVRLVMPGITVLWPNLILESAYSVLNMTDQIEKAAQGYMMPSEQPIQGSLPSEGLPFLTEERADGRVVTYLLEQTLWSDLMKKIWYLGMVTAGLWMVIVNIRFRRKLYGSRNRYEREDFKLPVYTAKELPSPCLYGLPGKQAVYLPEDLVGDEERVRHILAHEYCHYKQKDILWSAVRCVLLAVYWFHPLVWLAAVLSKQDCELACDEAAVRLLGEEERIAYGKTLVSLITRRTKAADIVCTATTMTADPNGIKERIQRIAESPRRLAFLIVPVLAAVAVVVVFTFTKAEDYPEGTYLLEGENSLTVTTSCFQVTFPESFAEKAYYRGANGTDIIVYHKDSDLEVGRFCMMFYEEAMQLALTEGKEVILIGNYGANASLDRYISGNHAEGAGSEGNTGGTEGENNVIGVPGTDSNETTTYYSPEVKAPGEETSWKASGDAEPVPAPELVEREVIDLPYQENEDYGAVAVEDHTYLPNENIEVEEDSTDYLPNEQITKIFLPSEQPCYLYIPADYSEADLETREELSGMNQLLEELADSVLVLYVSREVMEEALNTLVENRTAYVGDHVKVSKMAASLPAASGLSYRYLELETTTEPYGVTLHYRLEAGNIARTDSDIPFLEAVLMFSAIENLETCNIRIYDVRETDEEGYVDPSKMQYEVISYERKEMEALFGTLYPCSETKEMLTELYNRVLEYLDNKE